VLILSPEYKPTIKDGQPDVKNTKKGIPPRLKTEMCGGGRRMKRIQGAKLESLQRPAFSAWKKRLWKSKTNLCIEIFTGTRRL
jgi:hypothetical protein